MRATTRVVRRVAARHVAVAHTSVPVTAVRVMSTAQPQPSPFAASPEVKKAVSAVNAPTIGQGGQWRIVRTGGGRSSVSGITATVFGATGFVGRYVVNVLGRRGSQVVTPYRGEGFNARHLKLSGDLGQIVPAPFSMYDKDSILRTLARSNVAINLIGSQQVTKNFDLNDVNVKAAVRLATLAKQAGVERFIHISALGAAQDAPSEYLRSKWEGEQAILEIFPEATILRPGPIFGSEDRFLNRMAKLVRFGGTDSLPIPLFGNEGKQWVQPIHVVDVAEAIFNAIPKVNTLGKTYDLGGLDVYEGREIYDMIIKEMYRERTTADRPEWLGRAVAMVTEKMPQFRWRVWTQDTLLTARVDLVNNDGNLNGLKELGIDAPRRLEAHLPNLILKHRGMFGPRTQGMMVQEENNDFDNPLLIAHPDYNPAVSAAAREARERNAFQI